MPAHYRFDPARNLLVTWFPGTVTDDEILGLYRAAFADPLFEACTRELADHRATERFAPSTGLLHSLNQLTRDRLAGRAPLDTAVLAPNDLSFGVARMYGALADDGEENVGVFRTLEEAAAHIGLDGFGVAELDAFEAGDGD